MSSEKNRLGCGVATNGRDETADSWSLLAECFCVVERRGAAQCASMRDGLSEHDDLDDAGNVIRAASAPPAHEVIVWPAAKQRKGQYTMEETDDTPTVSAERLAMEDSARAALVETYATRFAAGQDIYSGVALTADDINGRPLSEAELAEARGDLEELFLELASMRRADRNGWAGRRDSTSED